MGKKKKTGTFDEWFSNYSQQNGIDVSGAPSSGTSYSNAGTTQQKKKTATFNDWFTNYQKENNIDLTQQRQTPSYTQQAKRYTNKPVYQQSQTPSYASNPLVQAAQNKVNANGDYKTQRNMMEQQIRQLQSQQQKLQPDINAIRDINEVKMAGDTKTLQKFNTYNDIEKKIADLQAQNKELSRQNKMSEYSQVAKNADYAQNSQYRSTANGKEMKYAPNGNVTETGFDDYMYDYINKNQQAITAKGLNTSIGDVRIGTDDEYLQRMTDDQIATFNYLYSKDKDQAYEYIETIKPDLQKAQAQYETDEWSKFATQHPVTASVFSIPNNLVSSTDALIGAAVDKLGGNEVDPNAGYFRERRAQNAIRGTVGQMAGESLADINAKGILAQEAHQAYLSGEDMSKALDNIYTQEKLDEVKQTNFSQKLSKFGNTAYGSFMSRLDSMFNAALVGGVPGQVLDKSLQKASLIIKASEAMPDALVKAKEAGLSDEQAFGLSVIAGAAEYVTEEVSMEALFDMERLATKGLMNYIGVNMLSEGEEEVASDLINFVAEQIIAGKQSEFQQSIREYENQNMSHDDAVKAAWADQIEETLYSFLGGAMAGGGSVVGVAVGNVANDAQLERIGEQVKASLPQYSPLQNMDNKKLAQFYINVQQTKESGHISRNKINQAAIQLMHGEDVNPALISSIMSDDTALSFLESEPEEQEGITVNDSNRIMNEEDLKNALVIYANKAKALSTLQEAIPQEYAQETQSSVNESSEKENVLNPKIGTQSEALVYQNKPMTIVESNRANVQEQAEQYRKNGLEKVADAFVENYDDSYDYIKYTEAVQQVERAGRLNEAMPKTDLPDDAAMKVYQAAMDDRRNMEVNNGRKEISVSGVSRGNDVQDSRGERGSVAQEAGREEKKWSVTRYGRTEDLSRLTYQRDAVSTKDLGIKNGTTAKDLYVVTGGLNRSEQGVSDLVNMMGGDITPFLGGNLKGSNGVESRAAVFANDNGRYQIVARMDHPAFRFENLSFHEIFHLSINKEVANGKNRTEVVNSIYDDLASRFDRGALDRVLKAYADIYDGSGLDQTEIKEELLADMLGDMNVFETNAASKMVQAVQKLPGVLAQFRRVYAEGHEFLKGQLARSIMDGVGITDVSERNNRQVFESRENSIKFSQEFAENPPKYGFGVTQEIIDNYVENAYANNGENKPYIKYAETSDRLINDLSKDYPDIASYIHALRDNDIRHMRNSRGFGKVSNNPTMSWDIEAIPYIVQNYDMVFPKTNANGDPGVLYVKNNGDNLIYYVEAVTEEFGNEKLLINKQMIKAGLDSIPKPYRAAITKKISESEFLDGIKAPQAYVQDVSQIHSESTLPQSEENDNTEFTMKQSMETVGNLVAVHNLDASSLESALDLGGFPMPSIAVTKAEMGHSLFGDISLVFGKETIDPKASTYNKVYSGDAWTPTFPTIDLEIDENRAHKLYSRANKVGYDVPFFNPVDLHPDNIERALQREGSESALIESFKKDYGMKQMYLSESGKGVVPYVTREREGSQLSEADLSMAEYFIDNLSRDTVMDIPSSVYGLNEFYHAHRDELTKLYNSYLENGNQNEDIDAAFNSEEKTKQNLALFKISKALQRYISGDSSPKVENDRKATETEIDKKVDDEGFTAWLEDMLSGINTAAGFRNGRDPFTPSGNRRSWSALHMEVNLENAVKVMRGQETQKGAGFLNLGSPLASATRDFTSIKDIKSHSSQLQIIPEEEYENIRKGFTERFNEIVEQFNNRPGEFGSMMDTGTVLCEDIANSHTKKQLDSKLKSEETYGYKYSNKLADDLWDLVEDIQNMPTGYFEAKPQRAVTFNEVKAALVPSGTSQELISRMTDAGVQDVVEYEAGNEEDRLAKLNSLDNAKFSRETDAEYMELAKDPDANKEQLQKMVESAAKEAFPNSILIQDGTFHKMWHHTNANFTSFLPGTNNTAGRVKGINFTPQEQSSMSNLGEKHNAYYLNVENPKIAYGVKEHAEYIDRLREMQEGVTDREELARINRQFKEETGVDAFIDPLNGWYNIMTPEQIKSADLVTYDGNGNVIPLSERFNKNSNEYRFSRETDIGYHAGDLGKSEALSQQSSGRDTGHFGTGTYFVGNQAKIEGYNSRNGKAAPTETVDFSKYNLFKPKSYSDALALHDFMRYVDGSIGLFSGAKTTEEYNELNDQLYDASEEFSENGAQEVTNDIDDYFFRDNERSETARSDAEIIDDVVRLADNTIGRRMLIDTITKHSSERDTLSYDESYVYDEQGNRITPNDYLKGLPHDEAENIIDWIATEADDRRSVGRERTERYERWREKFGDIANILGVSESELDSIITEATEEADQINYPESKTADSIATRVMKRLGYEGVDVRHIPQMDNTTYGSVIYDLKGEDLARKKEIGTARFSQEIGWEGNTSEEYDRMAQYASDLEEQFKELQKENKKNAERYQHFKNETRLTKNPQVDIKDARRIVKKITEDIDSIGIDKEVLAKRIQAVATDLQTGKTSWDDINEKVIPIANDIVRSAKILVPTMEEEIVKHIRETKIRVSDKIKHDIADYNDWRRGYFGRVKLSLSDGVSVEDFYNELRAAYGSSIFPADITNPTDQLMQITKLVDDFAPQFIDAFGEFEIADATQSVAFDMLSEIMNTEIHKTFADKKAEQISQLKKQNQEKTDRQLETLRKQRDERIAKIRKENTEHTKELLKNVREQRDQKIKEIKQHNKDVAANRRERRIESSDRQRLLKTAKRLERMKTTKANRTLIDELIKDLDLVAVHLTEKKATDLAGLRDWYEEHKKTHGYDFIPDAYVEDAISRLEKKHIADMDIEDVRDLTIVLRNIENEIRTQNKLIDSEDRRDVFLQGEEAMAHIYASAAKGKGVLGTLDDLLIAGTLSPERAIHRYTGYVDSDPLYVATKKMSEGQRAMMDYSRRADSLFMEWTSDRKLLDKIQGSKAEEIEITGSHDGKPVTVKITPAMRMSLYLHSLNPDNLYHISHGGVRVPDIKLYKQGKLADAYAAGKLVTLSPSQVMQITMGMSAKERLFARAAHDYFNGMSQQEINEVSEKLVGYSLAEVKNYFPINSDKKYTHSDTLDEFVADSTIQGGGYLKARIKNAGNAIMLRDMTSVLNQSIKDVSRYVGLAIPVRNFKKIWNVNIPMFDEHGNFSAYGDGVQEAVASHWGTKGTQYIENLILDIDGQARKSRSRANQYLNQIRSNYAGAVLTLNLSVAMKQAASYPTAAAVLGWKPLVKAFSRVGSVDTELIAKYTPLLYYRTKGFSTTELGDIAQSRNWFNRQVASKKWLNWVQAVDLLTTKKLWKAAEIYVEDNTDLEHGTDAFYKQVAEVYNQVIEETQPNYTAMQRPDILRDDNALLQTIIMFKTQPFQNFNVIYDAIGNWSAKTQQYKANPTEENRQAMKLAQKKAKDAGSALVVSMLVFAAMTFAYSMLAGKKDKYKDKEGNVDFESIMSGIGKDMASGFAGVVPFGSEIWELVASELFGDKYYGLDSTTVTAISDFVESCKAGFDSIVDVINTDDTKDRLYWQKKRLEWDKILKNTSKAYGIPYDNVEKLFNIMLSKGLNAKGEYAGRYEYLKLTESASYSSNKSDYYDNLYAAYKNDAKQFRNIYNDMVDFGFSEEAIKNAMEKRMKEEEGVSSVKDLKKRFSPPK